MSQKQQDQMMWKLLAPANEGEEMLFEGLDLRGDDDASKKTPVRASRPGSALKDSTGRRVVYGYEKFHQNAAAGTDLQAIAGLKMRVPPSPGDKGYNDGVCEGDRANGMLHGKGWRLYEKEKSWMGTLLPYGSLMNVEDPPKASRVITYERFQNEPGVLSRFDKPIVLVHGKNAIKSVMNCAKVLEMLKFSNGKAAALILEFEHINVQRIVYAQSKYSNMFMNFTFPIIAVSQDQFEFPREQMLWPHRNIIEARRDEIVKASVSRKREDSIEHKGWRMPDREDVPPEVTLTAKGTHKLDEMKQFPTDIDYDQAPKVLIEWFGTEMYAGEFSHGTKHGKGLFARANGDLMVGKFHRGSAHGACVYYHRTGNGFYGDWVHGKKTGDGELRTVRMHGAATTVQCAFRGFMARRTLEKLSEAAAIRERAMLKAAKLKEQEALELAKAAAEIKARNLAMEEESDHDSDV